MFTIGARNTTRRAISLASKVRAACGSHHVPCPVVDHGLRSDVAVLARRTAAVIPEVERHRAAGSLHNQAHFAALVVGVRGGQHGQIVRRGAFQPDENSTILDILERREVRAQIDTAGSGEGDHGSLSGSVQR